MATLEFLDDEFNERRPNFASRTFEEQQISMINMENGRKKKRRTMDKERTDYLEQSVQKTKNMEETKESEGMVALQKKSVFLPYCFI